LKEKSETFERISHLKHLKAFFEVLILKMLKNTNAIAVLQKAQP